MMREVAIRRSEKVALVDDEDYRRVMQYPWYLSHSGYVYGYFGNNRKELLHRFMLGLGKGDPFVDHRDHDPLNCVRSNLRSCTNQQNAAHKRNRTKHTSRFKGVCWCPRFQRWRATLTVYYKQKHVGYFDDEVAAAQAYDVAAAAAFGEFALLNFPEEDYSSYEDPIRRRASPASKFPGVRAVGSRWVARTTRGKRRHLGCFDTEEQAAAVVATQTGVA